MLARLRMLWSRTRDSLWFLPALLTLGAALVALGLVRFEQTHQLNLSNAEHWLLTGGVDGSRQVLSTIAGSLMTVTGVVFSVTVVALQLASSQFTPRILHNFMSDRVNQLVLGILISTFTFTLLVLRVIRSEADDNAQFVPHLAVAVAIVLALVSIASLIYFIHHIASSIQISVILSRVTREALQNVEHLFPEDLGKDAADDPSGVSVPDRHPEVVNATQNGYLQGVDDRGLFTFGKDRQMLIRMACPIGTFVIQGERLAEVWADEPISDEVADQLRGSFIIGDARTASQDVELGIIEIADIAVRSLSPGINDPTSALNCIDRLTEILAAFGRRRAPEPIRSDDGNIYFIAIQTDLGGALHTAFDQIVHYGRSNPHVFRHVRESLSRLAEVVPSERKELIKNYLQQIGEPASEERNVHINRDDGA